MTTPEQRGVTTGVIAACRDCSSICGYSCCIHALPDHPKFGPENAILMYPGEWDRATDRPREHLVITLDDFHGGKLAYCNREHFDQSKCRPDHNFKPLDCQSYPFAPAFEGGKLVLRIDSKRCPLARQHLHAHYHYILGRWNLAIMQNPIVAEWIKQLVLPSYVAFDPPNIVDERPNEPRFPQ